MVINKSKVTIRPEKPSEYEEVNKLIFEAFAEQHNIEIGSFMMGHFLEERRKETFIPELSLVAVLENGVMKDIINTINRLRKCRLMQTN